MRVGKKVVVPVYAVKPFQTIHSELIDLVRHFSSASTPYLPGLGPDITEYLAPSVKEDSTGEPRLELCGLCRRRRAYRCPTQDGCNKPATAPVPRMDRDALGGDIRSES